MLGCCAEVTRKELTPNRRTTRSTGAFRVECAITKEKKREVVEVAKGKLANSALVFSFKMSGLTVHQMESFRQSLSPEHACVYVCKNSLLKVAIDQTEGWEQLKSACKKENAFVFVAEDGIAETVQKYIDFEKAETKIRRDNAEKDEVVEDVTEIVGGAFNGQEYSAEEILKLNNLPTKTEAVAAIAGMLTSCSANFVATLNQAPMTLAANVERIADFDEDKTRTVREFIKSETSDEAAS